MLLPPPNLKGNYEGSCIVCLRGCDTALAVQAVKRLIPNFFTTVLGIPKAEAVFIFKDLVEGEPAFAKVCEKCAKARGLQVALVYPGAPLPSYSFYAE